MRLTDDHHLVIALPSQNQDYRGKAVTLFSPDISLAEITIGNEVIEHFALNVPVGFLPPKMVTIGFTFAGARPQGEPDGQLDMLFEPSEAIDAKDERQLGMYLLNNGFTVQQKPTGTVDLLILK